MEESKKVDGIKKISKEELEKSRKILLDYIGENEVKKKLPNSSKKIDGIFKVFSRKIQTKPGVNVTDQEIELGKNQLKNEIGMKEKKKQDEKKIKELERIEETTKLRLEQQERQREQSQMEEEKSASQAEKERKYKIAEAKRMKENEDKRRMMEEQEKERQRKLKIEEMEKQEEEILRKKEEIEKLKEENRLANLKKKEEQIILEKKNKEEEEKRKIEEVEKKKKEAEKNRKENERLEKIKKEEAEKRKRELEEEKKRLKEERLEKKRLKRKRFKNKIKNFKSNAFKNISNFKSNLKIYLKNIIYTFGILFSVLVLLYLCFSIIILKTEHDSGFARKIEKILIVPAYVTEEGVVRFYDYLEEKNNLYPGVSNLTQGEKELLRIGLLKKNVMKRLAVKYSIEDVNKAESIIELSKEIVNDPEVNQVGLNRITKIKSLIDAGESFEQVATKYGDKRERVDFDSSTEAYSRYGESVAKLQINQISDIVAKDGGYYMFKRFQSNEKFALSYVFIKGTSLYEFLEEYVVNMKVWSFVE